MSTPNTSLVKWVYKLILQKPPTKYEEGMVLYPIPVIPLADLTELVEGLRKIVAIRNEPHALRAIGKVTDMWREAQRLLAQLEAYRKEGA